MNRRCVRITLVLLLFLVLANTWRVQQVLNNFNDIQYETTINDLEIITRDMKKVSDAIFDNMIDTPEVTEIFKQAYGAGPEAQGRIRRALFELLEEKYRNFTRYGIQQLHFHLPDNRSFLRFHKPEKYGDDLSDIRASVKYVNAEQRPIVGFEEGKIFNGYRFVYPLCDGEGTHIGSVEVSSSLLNFIKQFEHNNDLHLEYILKRDVVERKLFTSQLGNYAPYRGMDGFLIQSTIRDYNQKHAHEMDNYSFLDDPEIQQEVKTVDKHLYYRLVDGRLYIAHFIPLRNDFTGEKVGYAVVLGPMLFVDYLMGNIVGSYLFMIFLSLMVGYIIYQNTISTETRMISEQLNNEVMTDSLTGAGSRKYYYKEIADAFGLFRRYGSRFSVIMYDIDFFKSFNDTYGHKTGDRVLMEMTRLVQSKIRKNDALFRVGGEEFLILLPQTGLEDAARSAEKIRKAVARELKSIDETIITVSMGVAEVRENDSEDTLFNRADRCLYAAKNSGRNKVVADLGC